MLSMTIHETAEYEITPTHTSSRSFEELKVIFAIPEDPKGLRFLDLGGGGSDLIPTLLERGADAYSVDQLYSLPDEEIAKRMERNIEYLVRDRGYLPSVGEMHREAYRRLLRSRRENPDRYKPAQFSQLPFQDGYFSHVFSHKAVIPYNDYDRARLVRVVREAIRVTSEGGTVQIVPVRDGRDPSLNDAIYEERQANQESLIAGLSVDPYIRVSVDETNEVAKRRRLTILKRRRAVVDFELRQPDYY